jgi:hypothetical protein
MEHRGGGTRLRAQSLLSHMPSASLGQYASLSFVVIGRGKKKEIFLWERLSSRDIIASTLFKVSTIYRLLLTAYRLPLTTGFFDVGPWNVLRD